MADGKIEVITGGAGLLSEARAQGREDRRQETHGEPIGRTENRPGKKGCGGKRSQEKYPPVIYALLGLTGEVFYVGLTTNQASRLDRHKQTYGPFIDMKVIQRKFVGGETPSCAERKWIKRHLKLGTKLHNKIIPAKPLTTNQAIVKRKKNEAAQNRKKRALAHRVKEAEKWAARAAKVYMKAFARQPRKNDA